MGSSREITLWLDERWYDALSRQLEDETVEGKLNDYLDNLISLLPTHIYDKINGEMREEQQQREQMIEAGKKYSAFRITENGSTEHFMMEHSVGMLEAARYVRTCLRQELGPRPFREMLQDRVQISAEDFDGMAVARIADGSRITDVFDINFDRQELSTVRSVSGWMTYRMKDVSTASWHAYRTGSYDRERRQARFMEKLAGKEESLEYRLDAVEKAVLLWKMDEHCQRQTGQTLEQYSAQLMAEDMAPPAGPAMEASL